MSNNRFQKYMLNKNIRGNDRIQLQLSQSDDDKKQPPKKDTLKQLKIDDLFSNRIRNKQENIKNKNQSQTKLIINSFATTQNQYKWNRKKQAQKIQQKKQIIPKFERPNKIQRQITVPIYQAYKPTAPPVPKHPYIQARQKQIEQQKKAKKQQKKEEQKKKQEQAVKRKRVNFKNFVSNYDKKAEQLQKIIHQSQDGQLNNILMFNKMQQENIQKMTGNDKKSSHNKSNTGLVYKKLTIKSQNIPLSFLKLLLSYKFSPEIVTKQTKKVPNSFEDQMAYKKTFHYLVVNECIADIQQRLKKVQQKSSPAISISISGFKTNSDGFVQFNMNQQFKQSNNKTVQNSQNPKQNQKFLLKNLSLSKNRLGLVTNAKNIKLDHYGIPSPKNQRIFTYLCMLVTPESKQDLNSQTKALCSLPIDSLQIILKLNKTNKCHFYDLQKISTHLREYQAISNLYETQISSFVYNPELIQKHHLDLIPEQQREQLNPILQKLQTQYNTTQYESIRQMVLRQSGIVLLQGPPGTGKTTTLMGLLAAEYEYLKNICGSDEKRKILICAPSNAAINHITKRLVCQGLASSQYANFSTDGSNQSQIAMVQPNILRVGIVETDDPDILSVSLDNICDKQLIQAKKTLQKRNNMTSMQIKQKMLNIDKQIRQIKARKDLQQWQIASKIQNLKHQYQRFNMQAFNFRKQKLQLKQTYNLIQNRLFDEADIILTTLSSSGSDKMQKIRGYIGCLIVDEAAQSTQPSILIPFQTGVRKVLLIGDPYQLPSTTISQDSSITLFNRSLFERFIDNGVKPYFLNIQYRMAPMIRQFPSKTFYKDRLIDAQIVLQTYQLLKTNKNNQKIQQNILSPIFPFVDRNSIFIDVKFGQQQLHSDSYRNKGEIIVLKNLILNFIKKTNLSIGVITPYQSQKKMLIKQLQKQITQQIQIATQIKKYKQTHKQDQQYDERGDDQENNLGIIVQEGELKNQFLKQLQDSNKQPQQINNNPVQINGQKKDKSPQQLLQQRVMINTVDSFQGQQKDIIIVSTVRSNDRKDIGFMKDQRRINVALTRSRHLLIVVGNGYTIGSNEVWNKYLEWSEEHKCYYQINQRESVNSTINHIYKGLNNNKIHRIKHKKLTKDVRRLERSQIRRQDFGLKSRKRVKIDDSIKNQYQHKQKQSETIKQQQNPKQEQIVTKIPIQRQAEQNDKTQQFFEKKRARQQQTINAQQINRKLKLLEQQLKQKIKADPNNPYALMYQ